MSDAFPRNDESSHLLYMVWCDVMCVAMCVLRCCVDCFWLFLLSPPSSQNVPSLIFPSLTLTSFLPHSFPLTEIEERGSIATNLALLVRLGVTIVVPSSSSTTVYPYSHRFWWD